MFLQQQTETGLTIVLTTSTQCRIYPGLRDPDPFITDARIDYGIFFEPREDSSLYSAIKIFKARNENNRVAHVQLTDERDTPLAISIETKNPKSTGGGVAGPAQLGTWVRAHFRHLESLPRADPDNLPMLPIIFVNGADWRVDFAQRTPDKLVGFLTFFHHMRANCVADYLGEYSDWFHRLFARMLCYHRCSTTTRWVVPR